MALFHRIRRGIHQPSSMASTRLLKVATLISGRIITTGSTMILFIIAVRILNKTDFSTFSQSILTYRFMVPFLSLGAPAALLFFIPVHEERSRAVLLETQLMLIVLGGLFSVFLLTVGGDFLAGQFGNPDLKTAIPYFALYPLFMLPMVVFGACMTACNQVSRFFAYNAMFRVLFLILVPAALMTWRTPEAGLLALTVSAGVTFIPGITLMFQACGPTRWRPGFLSIHKTLTFSFPVMISNCLGRVQLELDKVFVASYCSPEAFAPFVVAAQNLPFIPVLLGPVSSILRVDMAVFIKEKRMEDATRLWQSAFIKVAAIMYPVSIFLMLSAKDIIPLVFTDAYRESILPFQLYMLLPLLRSANFSSIALASGQSRLITFILSITVAGGIILNFLLTPAYGVIGATTATLITAYFLELPLYIYFFNKKLGFMPFKGFNIQPLLKIIVSILVSAAIVLMMPYKPDHALLRLGVCAFVYGVVILGLYRSLGIFGLLNLRKSFGLKTKSNG